MGTKLLKGTLFLALLLAVLACVAYWQRTALARVYLELPAFTTDARPLITQRVNMRDGTALATRIYLPEGDGPWPTILIRDPYSFYRVSCGMFVRYGYACVHQDVRGRFESEGEWYPVINERNDGLDTLDWLLEQDWQDGNIATYGSSYVGIVQWAMVDEMPPEVKTLVADVSHGDMYEIVYHNGHFIHGTMTYWMLGLVETETTLEAMAAYHPNRDSSANLLATPQRWYEDYLANPDKSGDYWNTSPYPEMREAHKQARMPVLLTAAWHDFFLDGQFKVFEELPRRADSVFMVRTGSHSASPDADAGELVGGSFRLTLKWLAHHLRQESVSGLPAPGYHLQGHLDGATTHYPDWPADNGKIILHLDNLADAGKCDGGAMGETPAAASASVSFEYDPANPAPSRAGSYQFETGVLDQGNDYCSRPDVLSFASEPLGTPITILGAADVTLAVATSAAASAFIVKLQERLADGRVLNIRENIVTVDGADGDRQDIAIELAPIKWTARAGSTLRLDISSSSYPIFNAHPNVPGLWSTIEPSTTATQSLFSGQITLPIE
ncbi:MAG: CocE/NonD family hydrolase [Halioglobus sp.]|nr:CocE/NonD family hydrolase [Halioglobus sp.]